MRGPLADLGLSAWTDTPQVDVLGVHVEHPWQAVVVGLWLLLMLSAVLYVAHGLLGMLEAHSGCAGHDPQRCSESWHEARGGTVALLSLAAVPVVLRLAAS